MQCEKNTTLLTFIKTYAMNFVQKKIHFHKAKRKKNCNIKSFRIMHTMT